MQATERKERAKPFPGEMVRAILARSKTQFREVIKCPSTTTDIRWAMDVEQWIRDSSSYTGWVAECDGPLLIPIKSPHHVGQRIWVQETWRPVDHDFGMEDGEEVPTAWLFQYRAFDGLVEWSEFSKHHAWKGPPEGTEREYAAKWGTANTTGGCDSRWRPSTQMPRWASRITLEVTDVRPPERVQDISEDDILAEGVRIPVSEDRKPLICVSGKYAAADYLSGNIKEAKGSDIIRAYFASLWDSQNAKRGYPFESNPWVWPVEFKVVDGVTHDAMPEGGE